MRYLLSSACRPLLKRLARERTLCAFDFDGTLAPIVAHPDLATMRARTAELLTTMAALYPCVVISGRARADLLGKLGEVNVAGAIGNHGAETEVSTRAPRHAISQWKAALDAELGTVPGLWVEDKGLSLAVHYRQAPRRMEVRRRILAVGQNLDHVRLLGGKQVVNLMPEKAPGKGDALAAERDRLSCEGILYLGDDTNDEDAFALEGNISPVRIGKKRQSHARYYLRTQSEIDRLLELLIQLREEATD